MALVPSSSAVVPAPTTSAAPESTPTASESHLLLDVPPDVAERLNAWLAGEASAEVSLAMAADENAATLTVDGTPLSAAVSSLPTIVETHASLDGVTFFKTGEIGKVLVARPAAEAAPAVAFAQRAELPERPDGLTPPTAGIRKRMWRKRPVRDPREVEQVAVELEALRVRRPRASNAAPRLGRARARVAASWFRACARACL